MQPLLRPFTSDDYPAITAIRNTVYREERTTEETLRFQDTHRNPQCLFQRWVVERAGEIVAAGEYVQVPNCADPAQLWLDAYVYPHYQRQGIGSLLYHQLLAAVQPLDPVAVYASARDDMTRSVRFLTHRGFREERRWRGWVLDSSSFDSTVYTGLNQTLQQVGIRITTLQALEADPQRNRKLYELVTEVQQDIPHTRPHVPLAYEHFIASVLDDPAMLPDAYFLAVQDEDYYIGLCTLLADPGGESLYTDLTGVRRAYRRRGIALALKVQGIAYAQAHGYLIVRTTNAASNQGMLAINERLGFVEQPAWIGFVKVLKEV